MPKKNIIYFLFSVIIFNFSSLNIKADQYLRIGAIPDQNQEKLYKLFNLLSEKFNEELEVKVKYIPVSNYSAAVTGFRTGSLDLVWFGGLTGVQARLQTKGSKVIAQREIDKNFESVFIANKKVNINKIETIDQLFILKGKRFTYGSESSTSGRLMPEYFLNQAGVRNNDFKGQKPGFSGSHDATIALVSSGAYEVGVLNKLVWISYLNQKNNKTPNVKLIFTTPKYSDYHWLVQGNLDDKFGEGFTASIQRTIINLNKNNIKDKEILDLFGAKRFIKSSATQYKEIEQIGRSIGKIR